MAIVLIQTNVNVTIFPLKYQFPDPCILLERFQKEREIFTTSAVQKDF